jgi:UDP-3-O-[3-hydroxymyristoyl] N-acetylglucosamine deacetylase
MKRVLNRHLQQTISDVIQMSGIGLHSGKTVNLTLRPAAPDTGIVFVRTDLPGRPEVAATYANIFSTQMATTLAKQVGKDKIKVGTVEHLLAGLFGMGVDNLIVEIDGPEVPVMDGSALPYVEVIEQTGLTAQAKARTVIQIRKKVQLRVDDKWAVVEPSDDFDLRVSIEWDHPVIGFQEFHYHPGKTPFMDVAPARTFGFLSEVESLKRIGLARGGSLENAIVLDDSRVLNPEGLRFPNEFARHKVLDAVGDFKLAGFEFQGAFRMHRPGHDLHCRLVQKILSDKSNYNLITLGREKAESVSPQDLRVPERLVAAITRAAALAQAD